MSGGAPALIPLANPYVAAIHKALAAADFFAAVAARTHNANDEVLFGIASSTEGGGIRIWVEENAGLLVRGYVDRLGLVEY
jgi:hypothetical protein